MDSVAQPGRPLSTLFRRPARLGLAAILVVFLLLAILHSLVVPISQGEDELAHYRYISFIAQYGRLPVNEAEREQAWYRADWPPLYHLLVGWAVSSLDTQQPHLKDVGESPRRRLVGEIFYPRLIIYTEDANWPWQAGILAWHIGRFISIFFSIIALIFTYLTALELGNRITWTSTIGLAPELFALAVTALLAFSPRFLFTSAMLGDDGLFILLSAVFIWLLLRAVRGTDQWWVYMALGLLLGLSIATKYSTALLPLILIPVVWWRARQMRWGWRQACGRLGLGWLFILLGSGWWFGWIIYYFNTIEQDGLIFGLLSPILASGPDVSMRRVFDFLGGAEFTGSIRPGAVAGGSFWEWWVYLFQTFWGVPVLEHDPFFPWAYLLLFLFCLTAVIGLWRLWKTAEPPTRFTLGILALIISLLFPFPLLRYFLTFNILETGQGRHILYPAAQASPILLTLGWLYILDALSDLLRRRARLKPGLQRDRARLKSGLQDDNSIRARLKSGLQDDNSIRLHITHYTLRITFYVLLLIWSILQLVYMAKIYPAPLPVQTNTFNPAAVPQPLNQNFGEAIQLIGYDFQLESEPPMLVLTLFWQALKPVDENYRTQVKLMNPAGQPVLTWLSHPLNGRYPTRVWDQGDVVRDTLQLPLAVVPANQYTIQLDLLREAEDRSIAAPLQLRSFTLEQSHPIVGAARLPDGLEFQLWSDGRPVRERQTISLSWSNPNSRLQSPTWILTGPDGLPRRPASSSETLTVFIVGGDWPSGDYQLGLENRDIQTETRLTIANQARLFKAPPDLTTQSGWTPVEANFGNQIKLLGYIMPQRRFEPGSSLPLNLAWQGLAPVLPDALTFAVLLDAGQQAYGQVDRYPSGFYSPILWVQGEVTADSFSLSIEPDAPPGVYYLHLGQYQLVNGRPQSLPLMHGDAPTDKTAVVIGPFKVGGPPPEVTTTAPSPQIILNQSFADQITLLGYDVTIPSLDSGQNSESPNLHSPNLHSSNLHFTFYWRAEANLQNDYTTFLHLRNSADETVAQKDGPPAGNRYPASLWSPGEIIVDEIILPLDQVGPGEYTPVVGLYEYATGVRLPIRGVPANEVVLQPIRLEE